MPEQINANMQQWIDALRSGEYERATGSLYVILNRKRGRVGYCCLGVAEVLRTHNVTPEGGLPHTDLAEWLGVDLDIETLDEHEEWDPRIAIPSGITEGQLCEVLGVEELNENLQSLYVMSQGNYQGVPASALNDEYTLSFDQIANLLERYGVKDDE